MQIHIEELQVQAIIGLLDSEREHEQSVIVNLKASYDYTDNTFINYADMVTEITKELREKKYLLLEEALLGLQMRLIQHFPLMQSLEIKLTKPDILSNCSVALSKKWHF